MELLFLFFVSSHRDYFPFFSKSGSQSPLANLLSLECSWISCLTLHASKHIMVSPDVRLEGRNTAITFLFLSVNLIKVNIGVCNTAVYKIFLEWMT